MLQVESSMLRDYQGGSSDIKVMHALSILSKLSNSFRVSILVHIVLKRQRMHYMRAQLPQHATFFVDDEIEYIEATFPIGLVQEIQEILLKHLLLYTISVAALKVLLHLKCCCT